MRALSSADEAFSADGATQSWSAATLSDPMEAAAFGFPTLAPMGIWMTRASPSQRGPSVASNNYFPHAFRSTPSFALPARRSAIACMFEADPVRWRQAERWDRRRI